ncbi:MAG: pyridoxal-phosphate dependent enzyme [Pseudomonadota bacterium]
MTNKNPTLFPDQPETQASPPPWLSPSLLDVEDPARYAEQAVMAIQAGARFVHFDVVRGGHPRDLGIVEPGSDDTFERLTPEAAATIKAAGRAAGLQVPIDVHVMVREPRMAPCERFAGLGAFLDAGVDVIAVHWEAFEQPRDLVRCLAGIAEGGATPAVALRPDTAAGVVIDFLRRHEGLVGLINQAGVLPCYGGQVMRYRQVLANVAAFAAVKRALGFRLMVDGGVEPEASGRLCVRAGADVLVAGSAFFGGGGRDLETLRRAAGALRQTAAPEVLDVYDALASRIAATHRCKRGPSMHLVEAYHGGGKTFTTEQLLAPRLRRMGLDVVVVGLDISWTDRGLRARWCAEAAAARATGQDHPYFHALSQQPRAMHWRREHSDEVIQALEQGARRAVETGRAQQVQVHGCCQFDDAGGTDGTCAWSIGPSTLTLVEGVYGSAVVKRDWDEHVYIEVDVERAKLRAMVRDEGKVHRPPLQTRALYEDVYEPSYQREYLPSFEPRERASLLLDARVCDDAGQPVSPRIVAARPPLVILECTEPSCRHQAPAVRVSACRRCGQDPGNLIVGVRDEEHFIDSIVDADPSMWRYRRLLPIADEHIVTDGEGATPVVFVPGVSERLSRLAGVDVRLWAKLEVVNPTGTFKDREASYVVSSSRQEGQDDIVLQSTGNTAMAVTHYAGLAGLRSWAFIPESSRFKLWMPARGDARVRAHIVAVDGHPIDVKRCASDLAVWGGFPKVSPFYERCECNGTLGYEVAEALLRGTIPQQDQLRGGAFTWYVQTLSAGMGLIGYHLAMQRLQAWSRGRFPAPRILAVEIDEFAPIHDAWEAGLEDVGEEVATPWFTAPDAAGRLVPIAPAEAAARVFELTLWTTNIKAYYRHLRRMLLQSEGDLARVDRDEVLRAEEELGIRDEVEAILTGLDPQLGRGLTRLSETERASFIGFAGLVQRIREGRLPGHGQPLDVVLMLTGKGRHREHVLEQPDFVVTPGLHQPRDVVAALRG